MIKISLSSRDLSNPYATHAVAGGVTAFTKVTAVTPTYCCYSETSSIYGVFAFLRKALHV